jgi:hypothetical protein
MHMRNAIIFSLFISLSFCVLGCGSSTAPHFRNPEKTFEKQSDGSMKVKVDGRFYLTDTGLDVKKGDTLKFAATGEVNWNVKDEKSQLVGPDGIDGGGWGLWYTITDNIGYRPLFVGAAREDKAIRNGRLYLVIPEYTLEEWEPGDIDDPYYEDNGGYYEVTVWVNP